MRKLCLYGGSFDPVHSGHIEFADKINKRFKPESFVFIPTFYSPFKDKTCHSSNEHRINMLNLACKNISNASVSTMEIDRQGLSFTLETLKQYKEQYPHHKLYWVIGDDHINTLQKWKGYPEHFDFCDFIVLPRIDKKQEFSHSNHQFKDKFHFLNDDKISVSSTQIRQAITMGESIEKLVPPQINKYIQDNKLYR